jgi:DNA primase
MRKMRGDMSLSLTSLPHRIVGDEINLQVCPFCADRKWHFSFNPKKGKYNCFKCGGGSARKLQRQLGPEYRIEVARIERERVAVPEVKAPSLPKGFEACVKEDGRIIMPSYLRIRGVEARTAKQFGLGFLREGSLCNAVVFPYEFRGEKEYALRLTTKKVYRLRKGERGIYPCLRDDAPLGLLLEGPFDALWAWQCGLSGIGLFGTKVSASQREEINKLAPKVRNLVVAHDPDASDEAEKLACSFAASGNFERVGWLELIKDLDEYPQPEVLRILREETLWT